MDVDTQRHVKRRQDLFVNARCERSQTQASHSVLLESRSNVQHSFFLVQAQLTTEALPPLTALHQSVPETEMSSVMDLFTL